MRTLRGAYATYPCYGGDYGDKIKFTSLNTTKARRLAIGQKILGLPVIAIYKGGEKVAECVKDDANC